MEDSEIIAKAVQYWIEQIYINLPNNELFHEKEEDFRLFLTVRIILSLKKNRRCLLGVTHEPIGILSELSYLFDLPKNALPLYTVMKITNGYILINDELYDVNKTK